jgi:succinate dehydrogenase hydrophobic anchor subunit
LFSNVVYISSLVLLTLVGGFYGFSFWCTNRYWKIFVNTEANWHVSFLSPLFSLTYLYHRSNSLYKLLNINVPNLPFARFLLSSM